MTGEQKPGGLEVVDLNGLLQQAWDRLNRPDADVPGAMVVLQAMLVALERPLTPAEPAEARIRSLEAALASAQNADAEATAYLRAKLARAVEAATYAVGLFPSLAGTADKPPVCAVYLRKDEILHARALLAALQQEGE